MQEQVEVAVISTDGDINEAVKVLRSSRSYLNSPQESSQVVDSVAVTATVSFCNSKSKMNMNVVLVIVKPYAEVLYCSVDFLTDLFFVITITEISNQTYLLLQREVKNIRNRI